jgi:putative transposase
MARRHRIRFCGATYHVMARGNRKERIFIDDVDRRRFLKITAAGLQKFGAECYVYCLMDNHFHQVIHTPRANISRIMQHIDGLYTQYENWRHKKTGHVLEGRFTGIVIDDESYLRNAIAYVLRNPLEAGIVKDAGDWQWSSYRAVMGYARPQFETLEWLKSLYGCDTLEEAREMLAEDVKKESDNYPGMEREAAEGSHEFKRRVRRIVGATLYRAALPRSYRALAQPPLSEVFAGVVRADRRQAIMRAHVVHGYLLTEIANYLGLHPTTISRIVNRTGSYRLTRE